MPGEWITLKPNGGTPLLIDGDLVVERVDWGEQQVETAIAEGFDVLGGVAGRRRLPPVECEIGVQVRGSNSSEHASATARLDAAWRKLALDGGTIQRQVEFADGSLVAVESEVLQASMAPQDGWLRVHRHFAQVTLRFVRQPLWLGQEKVIASLDGSTDSIHTLSLTGVKGNLPGPARIAIRDREGEARRFVEIGQSWTHPAEQIEFGADEVDPGVGSLSGGVVELTPLVPSWQTVAELTDLDHKGSFRARVRASHDSEATVRQRVVYRIGDGTWRALDSVTLQAGDAWDLDLGAIHHHGDGTLSVRVQVHCDRVDSVGAYSFSRLTLMPTERYALARGKVVSEASQAIAGFDDFSTHTPDAELDGLTAPLGGQWAEAGDDDPPWKIGTGFSGQAAVRAAANDSSLTAGAHAQLGAVTVADVHVVGAVGIAITQPSLIFRVGIVARYVNANNFVAVVLQRELIGAHPSIALIKVIGGTETELARVRPDKAERDNVGVEVDASGNWSLLAGSWNPGDLNNVEIVAQGTDSDLATSGTLEDGGVGIFAARTSLTSVPLVVDAFTYHTGSVQQTTVDVVRADGLGVLTATNAYTADAAHQDPAPIADYRGSRILIPPGDSQLAVKVRRTNLDTEPDTGPDDDEVDITVYHRPAFVTLPGEGAQEEGIFV